MSAIIVVPKQTVFVAVVVASAAGSESYKHTRHFISFVGLVLFFLCFAEQMVSSSNQNQTTAKSRQTPASTTMNGDDE